MLLKVKIEEQYITLAGYHLQSKDFNTFCTSGEEKGFREAFTYEDSERMPAFFVCIRFYFYFNFDVVSTSSMKVYLVDLFDKSVRPASIEQNFKFSNRNLYLIKVTNTNLNLLLSIIDKYIYIWKTVTCELLKIFVEQEQAISQDWLKSRLVKIQFQ